MIPSYHRASHHDGKKLERGRHWELVIASCIVMAHGRVFFPSQESNYPSLLSRQMFSCPYSSQTRSEQISILQAHDDEDPWLFGIISRVIARDCFRWGRIWTSSGELGRHFMLNGSSSLILMVVIILWVSVQDLTGEAYETYNNMPCSSLHRFQLETMFHPAWLAEISIQTHLGAHAPMRLVFISNVIVFILVHWFSHEISLLLLLLCLWFWVDQEGQL